MLGTNDKKSSGDGEGLHADQSTGTLFAQARLNSRISAYVALGCSAITILSLAASAFVSKARNQVAAVPVGQVWEYPMVHWVNSPSRYEEDAKPMHVALKYIRGLYEVDPLDFSQIKYENEEIMLSSRIAELMAYTLLGTKENLKVSSSLEKSQTLFKMFSECKCVKRFLVSDVMITQPPLPMLRMELIGRFVIFAQDGRRPLPAEDLGYKSIVLYMSNDIPIFDTAAQKNTPSTAAKNEPKGAKSPDEPDQEKLMNLPKAVNPEGWYVVRSQIRSLTEKELGDLRQVRLDAGMKGIY